MSQRLIKNCILGLTFIVSACSLLYELLIAQTISMLVTNSIIWYSLTIGFYLLALGVGAAAHKNIIKGKEDFIVLINVELILTLLGVFSVISIQGAYSLFSRLWLDQVTSGSASSANASLIFFLIVFAMIILIGFFSGLELPLLIRLANKFSPKEPCTNRVLGMDYFGSLAAGLLFPLFLLPRFDLFAISFLTAGCNFFVAVFLWAFIMRLKKPRKILLKRLIFVLCLFSLLLFSHAPIQQFFLQEYYLGSYRGYQPAKGQEVYSSKIERYQSSYNMIDIVKRPAYLNPLTPTLLDIYSKREKPGNDFPARHMLFINRDFQFNTDTEEVYHEYFAHIPIVLDRHIPARILVLGAGDGLLIRELLKYPEVQEIIHVEIDAEMVRLAREHPVLLKINEGALNHPKVTTIIGDAYHYVKNSRDEFDAIYIDFPVPNDYNLSKLYSFEFYAFTRKILSTNGFMVFDATWITSYHSPEVPSATEDINSWPIFYSTLKKVPFESVVPFFVNLETDKEEYKKILRSAIDAVLQKGEHEDFTTAYRFMVKEKGEDFVLSKLLKTHAEKMQQGFIMVKNIKEPKADFYAVPNIPLQVLTAQRVRRALQFPNMHLKEEQPSKVNSIVRPTLPVQLSIGGIKLPY